MMHPSIGRAVMNENGTRSTERDGEKIIQFIRFGDYGRYVTSDPQVIEYLDKQIAAGRDDSMLPEQYNERITPPQVKAAQAQAQSRMLEEENRILKDRMRVLEEQAKRAK